MMRRNVTRVLFGIAVILLGIGVLGRAFGWWSYDPFAGWWTLLLIIPAIGSMAANRPNLGNIILLALGIWLLIRAQNWIPRAIMNASALAALFILIGIWLIVSGVKRREPVMSVEGAPNVQDSQTNDYSDCPAYFALFCTNHLLNTSRALRGGTITAIFGTIYLDLTNAVPVGNIELSTNIIFGHVYVNVPAGIRLETKGFHLFGRTENESVFSTDASMPVVTIHNCSIFGDLIIR